MSRERGGPLGSLLGSGALTWRARGHPWAYTASPGRDVDPWVACWGQRPIGGAPGGPWGLYWKSRERGGPLGRLLGSGALRWRARWHPGAYNASPGREVDPWVACWGQRPLGGGPGASWGLHCKSRDRHGPLGSLLGSGAPRWRARGNPGAYTASPGREVDPWLVCWAHGPLRGGPGAPWGLYCKSRERAGPLGSLLGSEAPRWRARGHTGAYTARSGREVDPWVACWSQGPLGGGQGGTLGPTLQVQGERWTPG